MAISGTAQKVIKSHIVEIISLGRIGSDRFLQLIMKRIIEITPKKITLLVFSVNNIFN